MKRVMAVTFLFVTFLAVNLFGGIKIVLQGRNSPSSEWEKITIMWEKGDLKFANPNSPQGSFLIKDNDFYVIDENQKKYVNFTAMMKMMSSLNEEESGNAPAADNQFTAQMKQEFEQYFTGKQLTKTGKKKTIAGYSCDEYKVKDDEGGESTVYFTKDAGLKAAVKRQRDAVKGKNKGDFFFLVDSAEQGILLGAGKTDGEGEFEVVSIEEKTIPAGEFSLDGYTEMSMNEMMNMNSGNNTIDESDDESLSDEGGY